MRSELAGDVEEDGERRRDRGSTEAAPSSIDLFSSSRSAGPPGK